MEVQATTCGTQHETAQFAANLSQVISRLESVSLYYLIIAATALCHANNV